MTRILSAVSDLRDSDDVQSYKNVSPSGRSLHQEKVFISQPIEFEAFE